jgi:RNA polymerase sigma-70 factor (ECF subfamily)
MRAFGASFLADALPLRPPAADVDPLIAALAEGDERALRVAYRDHHAHVRAFARRLVGDDAAAEDLVHEIFVRLPRAARRFRGESSLRTFLVSMAVNHARHHVRGAMRRRAADRRLAREQEAPVAAAADPVERRQLAQALAHALDELPLDQRVAFVLCEVEERTSVEAARIAGTSDGTMRARLHHAKKKLRAHLAARGFSEGPAAPLQRNPRDGERAR